MKTLKNIFTKNTRLAIVTGIIAAVAIPSAVLAWGPSRPTFTIEDPADYVTFNSITNNPVVGDERNFVVAKPATHTTSGGWSDNITVNDNEEYLVRIYIHNNAHQDLNLKAVNTRVSAAVSAAANTKASISGFVSADNAQPQRVWDDVNFTSSDYFKLNYVNGSAKIYNNGYAAGGNGKAFSDAIRTEAGAPVGYAHEGDGIMPGCFQYVSYVTFKVQANEVPTPNFTVEKKVRLNGETDWSVNTIEAKPGQKVDYQIGYKNTGNITQNDVIVKDTLPVGVDYVTGSTTLKNATHPNGNGLNVKSNAVVGAGLDIGAYTAGSNAYVRFTATMPDNDELKVCGPNTLRNSAKVTTNNGTKTDTVDVVVTKTDCGPKQQECKPGIPVGDERCSECVPNQNGEMPDDCVVTELPKTGTADTIMLIVAVATLATVASQIMKRKKLVKAEVAASDSTTDEQ